MNAYEHLSLGVIVSYGQEVNLMRRHTSICLNSLVRALDLALIAICHVHDDVDRREAAREHIRAAAGFAADCYRHDHAASCCLDAVYDCIDLVVRSLTRDAGDERTLASFQHCDPSL